MASPLLEGGNLKEDQGKDSVEGLGVEVACKKHVYHFYGEGDEREVKFRQFFVDFGERGLDEVAEHQG